MDNTFKVLISGASIAGPAAAYWLNRAGCEVTVVERAPAIRDGGWSIDFRGVALDLVDRMGIGEALRANDTKMNDLKLINIDGGHVANMPAALFAGDLEVPKNDVTRILVEATADDVEYRFGDSIATLEQDADGARVTFDSGRSGRFDLVVGADGLHSHTRSMAFGPEENYFRSLGMQMAVFTVDNFLGLDHTGLGMAVDDTRRVGVISADHNASARAMFSFAAESIDVDRRDTEAVKDLITEKFSDVGWEVPRLLETMRGATDFYFTAAAQIEMNSWSRGRVVLLGDAGYCAAPTSGRGTSQALIAAYVLAGELEASGGDHEKALAAYESELRDYISRNQLLGREFRAHAYATPSQEMLDEMAASVPEDEPDAFRPKEYF
ncbi:MAG TPA: FAD-dependent monooxygenase [Stackebrandtia sp.]|jgi:2-polyprenyl-6-methoxyphenol hydroxylase-like FAD-dependent oxidoreductase|uniref:FAD-dependent monooxygenase n=1 Tax=Stackebrandtia sp. TaxID=2023065 RepID=UPI002D3B5918|nr:FAD-dependent monooxygenase [Stackebrandtia sp.]HZE39560.1 FAD-dependent monooxygenase [Stackebrandtia sp.]